MVAMPGSSQQPQTAHSADAGEDLTDDDILDAMRHIPGYLDITTEDFRAIYRLAHRHALARLTGRTSAAALMRTGIAALDPGMALLDAAEKMVQTGLKGLPVVDQAGRAVGMLTETDLLRRLKVKTCCGLLLKLAEAGDEAGRCCRETSVREAMSAPVVTVGKDAGYGEVMEAFRRHDGRAMPVVDGDGRLLGLLLRKDFIAAYGWDEVQ